MPRFSHGCLSSLNYPAPPFQASRTANRVHKRILHLYTIGLGDQSEVISSSDSIADGSLPGRDPARDELAPLAPRCAHRGKGAAFGCVSAGGQERHHPARLATVVFLRCGPLLSPELSSSRYAPFAAVRRGRRCRFAGPLLSSSLSVSAWREGRSKWSTRRRDRRGPRRTLVLVLVLVAGVANQLGVARQRPPTRALRTRERRVRAADPARCASGAVAPDAAALGRLTTAGRPRGAALLEAVAGDARCSSTGTRRAPANAQRVRHDCNVPLGPPPPLFHQCALKAAAETHSSSTACCCCSRCCAVAWRIAWRAACRAALSLGSAGATPKYTARAYSTRIASDTAAIVPAPRTASAHRPRCCAVTHKVRFLTVPDGLPLRTRASDPSQTCTCACGARHRGQSARRRVPSLPRPGPL